MIEMVCLYCHKTFQTHKGRNKKFCSLKCSGAFRDKGRSYKQSRRNGENIALHRIIMEEYLGRSLLSTEDVHHINGDIRDNRIENLMVLPHSEHIKLEALNRSPEENAYIASFRIGGKRSEETRHKMSIARKLWWQKKRSSD